MINRIYSQVLIFILLLIPGPGSADVAVEDLSPTRFQSQVSVVVLTILDKYHYRETNINDSLSSIILDRYIDGFDQNKTYFLKSDIEKFEKYRYALDDALLAGNLGPAFEIFNVFRERFIKQNNYAQKLIDQSFDYRTDESIRIDRENADWAASQKELNDLWRRNIKNEKLSRLLDSLEVEKIDQNLKKRYENLLEWAEKLKTDDVFQFYMNSVSESFDPHTNYLLPIAYDNFMIGMSQSLEGIGARLRTDNEYTVVADIIAGGPAFKSKKLFGGDKIIAVAQGKDGEWVDVIAWRLDEVVQLIRGPKGSFVRLKILRAEDGRNAKPVEITLERDKIKIEEAAPQKEIMTINRDDRQYRIGVISIPSFYLDFEGVRNNDPDYKSTTRDVKKLLEEMKNEEVDALLLDLRNNGGGSLTEAIELTGLFIPDGPVVQIKNSSGKVDVQNDDDKNMYYEGPLGVLINRFSASASEIFSGAIQDYKRGVIVGEQSYGKGTVQNLLDLDRFITDTEEKPGQVKITLAKFYRVTGSSTQHKGVNPDIELPSRFDAEEFGESSFPSALPWDMISSIGFKSMDYVNNDLIRILSGNYETRLKQEPHLRELVNQIEDVKKLEERNTLSLNLEARREEKERAEKLKANRERLYGTLNINSEVTEVPEDEAEIDDPYLKEGLNIMADWLLNRIG